MRTLILEREEFQLTAQLIDATKRIHLPSLHDIFVGRSIRHHKMTLRTSLSDDVNSIANPNGLSTCKVTPLKISPSHRPNYVNRQAHAVLTVSLVPTSLFIYQKCLLFVLLYHVIVVTQ